ncbi:MAG TPA: phosphoadenylyl-sulfate reductase, partial [Planctomycetota bacterium]|nr:phosphoadenylyl-sulfate reductase [Planctomycetota bacterium]
PLYAKGYRSLGCGPCTRITTDPDERAGRWIGTSKCGGECGIHTRPLKIDYQI